MAFFFVIKPANRGCALAHNTKRATLYAKWSNILFFFFSSQKQMIYLQESSSCIESTMGDDNSEKRGHDDGWKVLKCYRRGCCCCCCGLDSLKMVDAPINLYITHSWAKWEGRAVEAPYIEEWTVSNLRNEPERVLVCWKFWCSFLMLASISCNSFAKAL